MAGIQNNEARIFNLKYRTEGNELVVVRLHPGLNFVEDKDWAEVKKAKLAGVLLDEGRIVAGKKVDQGDEKLRSMSKRNLVKEASSANAKAEKSSSERDALAKENEELKERMEAMEKRMEELSKAKVENTSKEQK